MKKFDLPQELVIRLKKYKNMRYGENPHQRSAFYLEGKNPPGYKQIWGIELSHNNLGDANHAWRLVCEFDEPTVAIIKHGNPSGIASRNNLRAAFEKAFRADKVSAFGGIVAVNKPPSIELVEGMHGIFFELLVAPDFDDKVLERLKKRSKKMRIVKAEKPPSLLEFTRVFNGYLVQTPDNIKELRANWKVVCGDRPNEKKYQDLEFAWKVVKHIRSNAIVIVKNKCLVGMGTGQPNRVNSVKLALTQGSGKTEGAVLASDAFFPFPDNVLLSAEAGIDVIIQPGGSINDAKVIEAAKKHNITMIFTGVRHFKH